MDVTFDRFSRRSRRRIPYLLSHVASAGLLQRLETVSALAQGKGWGAASIRQEVGQFLSLIPREVLLGATFLDVGANRGDWTGEVLRHLPDARVYCFEPEHGSLAKLRPRFIDNPNISIRPYAVGDVNGVGEIVSPDGLPSHGYVALLEHEFADDSLQSSNRCRVIRLDDWAAEIDLAGPIVLKVDIEGSEIAVLRGANRLLDSVVAVEFETGERSALNGGTLLAFYELFSSRGFRLYRFGPRAPVFLQEYRPSLETALCTNYFAIRDGSRL